MKLPLVRHKSPACPIHRAPCDEWERKLSPALVLALILLFLPLTPSQAATRSPNELAWSIRYDPRTLDPAKVDEQSSETLRFLTAGVLLRLNPQTQQPETELAQSWSLSPNGRLVTFTLRDNLRFSDGSPLTAADAAFSIRRVLAPEIAAPVAEEFLDAKAVQVETPNPHTLLVRLPQRVIDIGKLFNEIAIEPANRPSSGRVTSGPFVLADYKPGQSLRLTRNSNYWRHDAQGVQLPYASAIRLDILANRDQDTASFEHGDYDLIDNLSPDAFTLLARRDPRAVRDLGPSLNTEQLWLNQAPAASLPAYEKSWFTNRSFRIAVSQAIHRADLARIAYSGHATPAYSFISPANKAWANTSLQYPHENPAEAQRLLAANGFHRSGPTLYDAANHPVAFSILTNAGNPARQRMATMIQQDLAALGIQITVVTLDFPALIERLMHKQDYEACLLGTSDADPDPNSMMNLWLSSSPNHQWSPSEPKPATLWEAEVDTLMHTQATDPTQIGRKRATDRLQQIIADQQPFIYLVYPNALVAVSPRLSGVQPIVFSPGLVWNIPTIHPAGASK